MGNSVVANQVSGSRPETPDKPDTDIVRTLSPVASPAGQATAPEGRRNNKKKKPKRTGKKKDVRNAEPVGTALPEASTEPQSTVLASPWSCTVKRVMSMIGVPGLRRSNSTSDGRGIRQVSSSVTEVGTL